MKYMKVSEPVYSGKSAYLMIDVPKLEESARKLTRTELCLFFYFATNKTGKVFPFKPEIFMEKYRVSRPQFYAALSRLEELECVKWDAEEKTYVFCSTLKDIPKPKREKKAPKIDDDPTKYPRIMALAQPENREQICFFKAERYEELRPYVARVIGVPMSEERRKRALCDAIVRDCSLPYDKVGVPTIKETYRDGGFTYDWNKADLSAHGDLVALFVANGKSVDGLTET